MKRIFTLTSIFAVSTALFFTSCGPSRVYGNNDRFERRPLTPPPRYYGSSASLIISPQPGFRMNQYSNGRYYHRSPQGFLYWKGYDNRFYLDRSYLNKVNYGKREYKEWKRYSKNNRR